MCFEEIGKPMAFVKRFYRAVSLYPLLLLLAGMLASASSHALLPAAMGNGDPLPSLAPMLKSVNPAVVNISTYTTRNVIQQYDIPLSTQQISIQCHIPNQPAAKSMLLKVCAYSCTQTT